MTSLADLTRGPERAFPTHARLERYYPAAGAEEARGVLVRTIERGEGPALLIGSPGTGKSMLLQVVAHDVSANRAVACVTSAQLCTRRALLQSILFELGQPFRQRDEGELRLELIDYLQSANVGDRGVVLLVDEAQSLPTRLLEELRVLSNLSNHGDPRLHLVLAGSQALDEKFTSPEVEAFNQRIAARCYLSPFNHHDTAQYVRGHLAAAGADPDDLFTGDALRAVYEATGGIARLVNQLCDRALLLGSKRQALRVNRDLVQGAWADLQQLPTPWNLPDTAEDEKSNDSGIGLLEYGSLREEEDLASPIDETELDEVFDPFEDAAENRPFHRSSNFDRPEFPPARVFAPDDDEDLELLEEELELAEPDERFDARVDEFDENFQEYEPVNPTVGNSSTWASDEPTAPNPFDEMFDDEEIVIDPFAGLEAVFATGATPVRNTFEKEISGLLHKVKQYDTPSLAKPVPAVDATSFGNDDADSHEHTETRDEIAGSFTIVKEFGGGRSSGFAPGAGTEESEEGSGASTGGVVNPFRYDSDDEESSLSGREESSSEIVVEDDTPGAESPSIAFPTDYRQLFASLRKD